MKSDRMFVKGVLAAVLAIVLIVAVWEAAKPAEVTEWTYHSVAPGDTLWSIAEEYNPDYTGDVRSLVHAMETENGIDGDVIFVGDLIKVAKTEVGK